MEERRRRWAAVGEGDEAGGPSQLELPQLFGAVLGGVAEGEGEGALLDGGVFVPKKLRRPARSADGDEGLSADGVALRVLEVGLDALVAVLSDGDRGLVSS